MYSCGQKWQFSKKTIFWNSIIRKTKQGYSSPKLTYFHGKRMTEIYPSISILGLKGTPKCHCSGSEILSHFRLTQLFPNKISFNQFLITEVDGHNQNVLQLVAQQYIHCNAQESTWKEFFTALQILLHGIQINQCTSFQETLLLLENSLEIKEGLFQGQFFGQFYTKSL